MWLLLVGTGYNAIAHVEGGLPYHAFVFPGVVVMAALFGGMLTAIGTVYDREFGMLRLMLASPAGVPAVLGGRAVAAALVGLVQGAIVLACAPLVVSVTARQLGAAVGALALASASSAVLGLLVAARLRSVENFAGVINVVLFPLLFVSGALYPTGGMPLALRILALINPVTYQVDLMRHALGQPAELGRRGRGRAARYNGTGVRAHGTAVRSGAAISGTGGDTGRESWKRAAGNGGGRENHVGPTRARARAAPDGRSSHFRILLPTGARPAHQLPFLLEPRSKGLLERASGRHRRLDHEVPAPPKQATTRVPVHLTVLARSLAGGEARGVPPNRGGVGA